MTIYSQKIIFMIFGIGIRTLFGNLLLQLDAIFDIFD